MALAGTALAFATAISAQTPASVPAQYADDSTCTYVKCALGFRDSATKSYLTIGSLGRAEVIGLTGRSIARATASVPAAAAEARLGGRLHTVSSVIQIAGGVGLLYFVGKSVIPRNDLSDLMLPLRMMGGVGKGLGVFTAAFVISIPSSRLALGHYRVAIGLYNATLPR